MIGFTPNIPIFSTSTSTRPPAAVAIIYKFDQNNDTYFQYLWPIGRPEPLTVKSENSGFGRNWYTGCPKIGPRKYINDFLSLKIWPLTLRLTKTQNCHLFSLFQLKNSHFHGYFVTCWWRAIFFIFSRFFGAYWFKKMAILCFDQCQIKCSYF